MMKCLTTLACAAAVFVAGCSGGTESSNAQAAQLRLLYDTLRAARQSRNQVQAPAVTRTVLDQLTVAALEVTIENTGATAFLVPLSEKRDTRPGLLRTWRSTDNAQITLRDGVIAATRGLGFDLGSAQVDAAVRGIQSRTPVSGVHSLYVKNGNNGVDEIALTCEMRTVGSENLVIVERSFPVVHLQENCTGWRGVVAFDYWVDRRDGTVWQTRQWTGPDLGYIRTRLLNK